MRPPRTLVLALGTLAPRMSMSHSQHTPARCPTVRVLVITAVALLGSCSRTIEEDEPRELVEHRIEPCRQWCDAMQSPDCGRIDDPQPYETAEECTEDCAAVDPEYPSQWAPQPDGTDACAEEWYAVAACFDGLTCEEQRSYFRRETSPYPPGFACVDELEARSDCYSAMRDEQQAPRKLLAQRLPAAPHG